jgi:prevent-host-death family protein
MSHTVPLAEAKKNLSRLVKEAGTMYDRFVITRNGIEAAVLMSASDYAGLLETLDILSHKDERQAIARAKRQVRRGQTVSLESFKKKINSR